MKTYHLTVTGEEKQRLMKLLENLPGERCGTVIAHDSKNGRSYDVIFKMTEEELIYAKLSCKIEKVVNVDDWQKQCDTVSHVGSIIAGM